MKSFEIITDYIEDPVFVKDRQYRYVYLNDAACEMFGITRELRLGKTDYDLFSKEQADIFRKHDEYVFETGKKDVNEEEVTDHKGNVRMMVAKKRLYIDEAGEKYIIGVIHEITERKKAEEVLRESEATYRTVVESALVGVYIVQDGLFRFVNKRWCEIHGYTFEETVGKLGPTKIAHPEDRGTIREHSGKLFGDNADMKSASFTHRAITKDGRTITTLVLVSPMTYRGRQAATGTVLDVTEHEKAQDELRRKSALLEAQLNTSLDGILVVDHGKKILQNRKAAELLQIPEDIASNDDDELQVKWVRGLARNPEGFYEKVVHAYAHPDETMREELELLDGVVLDMYTSPVVDKDGKCYGRIWTFRDITERKQWEKTLLANRLKLSEAMELVRIVYWETDVATGVFTFNDAFYNLYATTAESEGGYSMTIDEYAKRFVHPDDIPSFYENVAGNRSISDSASQPNIEHRIIGRDGKVRYIMVRTRSIRDSEGKITRIIGANLDITDRRKTEEQLYETEERFRLFLEYVPIYVFFKDENIRVIQLSRNFENMLGRPINEMIGKTMGELFPYEFAEQMMQTDLKVLREGKAIEYQEEFEGRYYTTTKFPIMRKGKPALLAGFTMDMTESKRSRVALEESVKRLERLMRAIIDVISMAVEVRDPYTSGHQKSVSDLAQAIAAQMGLPAWQIDGIRVAGLIHDLGKIAIPAEILSLPRRLTELEFELVKTHVSTGYDILKNMEFPWPIADIVLQHHERLDGSGYPQGLSDGGILLEAKIIAVADVVEAIASHRPYRPALGIDVAMEEIEKGKGILYDPEAVNACLKLFREKGYKIQSNS